MKRILLVILLLVFISVPTANIFSADYFLFDRENNKILYMGAYDTEFTEKIEMEKNPDRLMPTGDPDKYLAIFAPEVKKGKEKDAQKGQLIVYNIATGRTEDLVDMGYSPFNWVYTDDHNHIFITYRPTLTSDYYELLHYNIAEKTTEKIADFTKKITDLALSYDESKLFALIPGEKKTPGKIEVLSYEPLQVNQTIEMDVNPQGLFALSPDRFTVIDADEKIRKKPGAIKIFDAADCSMVEDFKFDPPYTLTNHWYKDDETLITMVTSKVSGKDKTYACKVTSDGIKTQELPPVWYKVHYENDMDSLFILTGTQFFVIDYELDQVTFCDTGSNTQYHTLNYIPETKMVILFTPQGGKVKFIDLGMYNKPKMVKSSSCGRASAKFGNFMTNLLVSVALSSMSYYSSYNYGYYYVYSVNLFRNGTSVAADPEESKYYVLRNDTRDITVFTDFFETVSYVVPPEAPLTMYQVKRTKPKTMVVTGKKIYQINADNSLTLVYEFKQEVSLCFFFEEENRLIVVTEQNLLVMDPETLEVKNDYLFYGNPDEKYTHLKKGEQRYYFIPSM